MQIKEMFTGIKVLELASVLAGPAVGQFFAELGADVIKIENPNTNGDVTRSWKVIGEDTDDISAYFSCVNWGKKSVCLDLRSAKDVDKLHKLVADCDFVIASYKPGDAEKLGVDYDSFKKLKKDIIYGEVTGYGHQTTRVGYDAVIQAEAGFMYINGEESGGPVKMPVALMDILASHQLKEAMLLAYIKKMKSGEGSHVSVSLIESAISSLANQGTNWLVAGNEPKRKGSSHPNIAPYGDIFTTKDGANILLAVGNDEQFRKLCLALDIKEMVDDSRFKHNAVRVKNREVLNLTLQSAVAIRNIQWIIPTLNELKVPVGEVRSVSSALSSKEAKSCLINHENLQGIRTFSAYECKNGISSHFSPPPHLGEHTEEVLGQL